MTASYMDRVGDELQGESGGRSRGGELQGQSGGRATGTEWGAIS